MAASLDERLEKLRELHVRFVQTMFGVDYGKVSEYEERIMSMSPREMARRRKAVMKLPWLGRPGAAWEGGLHLDDIALYVHVFRDICGLREWEDFAWCIETDGYHFMFAWRDSPEARKAENMLRELHELELAYLNAAMAIRHKNPPHDLEDIMQFVYKVVKTELRLESSPCPVCGRLPLGKLRARTEWDWDKLKASVEVRLPCGHVISEEVGVLCRSVPEGEEKVPA